MRRNTQNRYRKINRIFAIRFGWRWWWRWLKTIHRYNFLFFFYLFASTRDLAHSKIIRILISSQHCCVISIGLMCCHFSVFFISFFFSKADTFSLQNLFLHILIKLHISFECECCVLLFLLKVKKTIFFPYFWLTFYLNCHKHPHQLIINDLLPLSCCICVCFCNTFFFVDYVPFHLNTFLLLLK